MIRGTTIVVMPPAMFSVEIENARPRIVRFDQA
jgi:hypothetical protein